MANVQPGLCLLCREFGHIARDCPNRGNAGPPEQRKRAFGSFAHCYMMGAHDRGYGRPSGAPELGNTAEDTQDDGFPLEFGSDSELVAFNLDALKAYGIWDPGATRSCGGFPMVQDIVDHNDGALLGESDVTFTFAGGDSSDAGSIVHLPHPDLSDGYVLHILPNPRSPVLLGLDVIRYYGLVLDYYNNTVYSHRLKKYIPSVVLPSGHLAIRTWQDSDEQ